MNAQAYVHQADVMLAEGTDPASVGATVTIALCGHWEHDGPCRWPHHNQIDGRQFRTVFIATPEDEPEVRRLGFELRYTTRLAGAFFRTPAALWQPTSRRWPRDWYKHHDRSDTDRTTSRSRATAWSTWPIGRTTAS